MQLCAVICTFVVIQMSSCGFFGIADYRKRPSHLTLGEVHSVKIQILFNHLIFI